MLNLLKADLGRIFSSKGIYITIGLLLSAVLMHTFSSQVGAFDVENSRASGYTMLFHFMLMMDNIYLTLVPIVYFAVSDDFEQGTIKNVLSGNVSRTTYYLSKLVLALSFCFLFYVLQVFGGALLTTALHGFGRELTGEFIWSVAQPVMAQLLVLFAITAIGVFLAFTLRKLFWFSVAFFAFIMLPVTIIGFLWEAGMDVDAFWRFELITQTRNLINIAYMPAYEIFTILGIVLAYLVLSTIGGLKLFQKSEIK